MTGKIIVDALERPNGARLTLPMSVDQGGSVVVDAAGQIAIEPQEVIVVTEAVKVLDFTANPTASVDVLWDDLQSGLTLANIAFLRLRGCGISSSAAFKLMFAALSGPGAPVAGGAMAANAMYLHGGGTMADTQSTTADGTMSFPAAASADQTGNSRGPGCLNFEALLHPHPDTDSKGVAMHINGSYMQNAAYNYGTVESTNWKNQATSAGIAGFTAGLRVYPSAGTLDRGFLEVAAVLKPGA